VLAARKRTIGELVDEKKWVGYTGMDRKALVRKGHMVLDRDWAKAKKACVFSMLAIKLIQQQRQWRGGWWRTNRRTRWKTTKLYKRKTSMTRRRTLQVQWSGWYRRGRYWHKTGPGGEEGRRV
jgi:hypothetical protein